MLEYSEGPTNGMFKEKAELLRLLGHPTRLAIIRQLAQRPRCVTDIRDLLDVPQANVSQHLTALRSMRVVDFHEDGNLRCYYIARPTLASLLLQFLGEDYRIVEQSKDEVRRFAKRQLAVETGSASHIGNGDPPAADSDLRSHWEKVYSNKGDLEVSWHQDHPSLSLELIRDVAVSNSRIIDVGGGSSPLASHLLALGVRITVLDISKAALDRAKTRMGDDAENIHWLVNDVVKTDNIGQFDVWHDRAVFHFLTRPLERSKYVHLAERSIVPGGHLVIGTFALDGPQRCSGLPVERYDSYKLANTFGAHFRLKRESSETHTTPWGSKQQFIYAVFERQ